MGLAENLNALRAQRNRSSERRKAVLGTILALARERQSDFPQVVDPGSSLSGSSSRALEQLSPIPVAGGGGGGGGGISGARGKSGFDTGFEQSLNRLLKDFKGQVKVNSGYRSPQRQAQLYAQALRKYGSAARARKWVAPPGKSNHGRGIAADLGFANARVRQQVHANAAKYGLHFPMAHENWHIEPIRARKK